MRVTAAVAGSSAATAVVVQRLPTQVNPTCTPGIFHHLCRKKPTGAVAAGEPAEQQPVEQQQQQQQERKKKGPKNLWSLSTGWKTVHINDELILGADEFGFAGLEVLEDASVIDPGTALLLRVLLLLGAPHMP